MILYDVGRSTDQFFLNTKHARCLQFNNLSTVEIQQTAILPGMFYIGTAPGSASYGKAGILVYSPTTNAFPRLSL
jgi:hypothetical protein